MIRKTCRAGHAPRGEQGSFHHYDSTSATVRKPNRPTVDDGGTTVGRHTNQPYTFDYAGLPQMPFSTIPGWPTLPLEFPHNFEASLTWRPAFNCELNTRRTMPCRSIT